jgi:hypothetical protein
MQHASVHADSSLGEAYFDESSMAFEEEASMAVSMAASPVLGSAHGSFQRSPAGGGAGDTETEIKGEEEGERGAGGDGGARETGGGAEKQEGGGEMGEFDQLAANTVGLNQSVGSALLENALNRANGSALLQNMLQQQQQSPASPQPQPQQSLQQTPIRHDASDDDEEDSDDMFVDCTPSPVASNASPAGAAAAAAAAASHSQGDEGQVYASFSSEGALPDSSPICTGRVPEASPPKPARRGGAGGSFGDSSSGSGEQLALGERQQLLAVVADIKENSTSSNNSMTNSAYPVVAQPHGTTLGGNDGNDDDGASAFDASDGSSSPPLSPETAGGFNRGLVLTTERALALGIATGGFTLQSMRVPNTPSDAGESDADCSTDVDTTPVKGPGDAHNLSSVQQALLRSTARRGPSSSSFTSVAHATETKECTKATTEARAEAASPGLGAAAQVVGRAHNLRGSTESLDRSILHLGVASSTETRHLNLDGQRDSDEIIDMGMDDAAFPAPVPVPISAPAHPVAVAAVSTPNWRAPLQLDTKGCATTGRKAIRPAGEGCAVAICNDSLHLSMSEDSMEESVCGEDANETAGAGGVAETAGAARAAEASVMTPSTMAWEYMLDQSDFLDTPTDNAVGTAVETAAAKAKAAAAPAAKRALPTETKEDTRSSEEGKIVGEVEKAVTNDLAAAVENDAGGADGVATRPAQTGSPAGSAGVGSNAMALSFSGVMEEEQADQCFSPLRPMDRMDASAAMAVGDLGDLGGLGDVSPAMSHVSLGLGTPTQGGCIVGGVGSGDGAELSPPSEACSLSMSGFGAGSLAMSAASGISNDGAGSLMSSRGMNSGVNSGVNSGMNSGMNSSAFVDGDDHSFGETSFQDDQQFQVGSMDLNDLGSPCASPSALPSACFTASVVVGEEEAETYINIPVVAEGGEEATDDAAPPALAGRVGDGNAAVSIVSMSISTVTGIAAATNKADQAVTEALEVESSTWEQRAFEGDRPADNDGLSASDIFEGGAPSCDGDDDDEGLDHEGVTEVGDDGEAGTTLSGRRGGEWGIGEEEEESWGTAERVLDGSHAPAPKGRYVGENFRDASCMPCASMLCSFAMLFLR